MTETGAPPPSFPPAFPPTFPPVRGTVLPPAAAGEDTAISQGERIVRSILFAAGAVALVLVALSGITGWSEYTVHLRDAERRVEAGIAASEQNVKLAISSLESVMRAVGDRMRVGGLDQKSLNDFLDAMDKDLPSTRSLLVVDNRGVVVADSRPRMPADGLDVAAQPFFSFHIRHTETELFIGPLIKITAEQAWSIPVSRCVRNEHGELTAVIVALIDPKYIAKLLAAIDAGADKLAALLHTDGTVLSVFPYDHAQIGRVVADLQNFDQITRSSGEGPVHGMSEIDQVERIIAYRMITPWPLAIEVGMPRRDALGRFYTTALVWSGVLVLFLVITVYVTDHQIRQTRQLATQTVVIQRHMSALRQVNDSLQREMGERRQAETERDRLFDLSLDMLSIAGTDGWFKRVNPAFEATLGYRAADLLSRPLIDFVHHDDGAETRATFKKLADGHPIRSFENRIRHRDGSYRWLSWNSAPQDNLIYSVTRDVTEPKMIAEQLDHARLQAEAANRAKSDFLANMSHELRTPLNGVIGYAEALQLGIIGVMPRKQLEYVENILSSGNLLLSIVNDLLDLSVVEAGRGVLDESMVDITAAFDSAMVLVRERARKKRLKLRVQLPNPPPMMRCDETKLKQILVNLLVNAIKFTPEDGKIELRAIPEHDGVLTIAVADTGIGIAAEDIPHVLTPFGQVEPVLARKQGGVGLGLPLVLKLTELHGGTLELQSMVGVGTTILVHFPAERVIWADTATRLAAARAAGSGRG
ncbi:hypothetical protein WCLP8_1430035 [uncultured Gammaproteobacteria bacterium]